MHGVNSTERGGTALLGLLLALGLVVGGWILGAQIKETRLGDRYVTVKGLAERNVKSDLAIWPIGYKEAGDDLTGVYAKSEADKKATSSPKATVTALDVVITPPSLSSLLE